MGLIETKQLEDEAVVRFKNLLRTMYLQLATTQAQALNLVYNNPKKIQPQKFMDAYGTDAYLLFEMSADVAKILKKYGDIDPDLSVLDKWDIVINPDGRVTVTKKETPSN